MATEGVLKYMLSTNRPYSANDIVQNMHKEFGKTSVQKALDDLVAQGNLIEKVYGKQKVYYAKQPENSDLEGNELEDIDSQIEKSVTSYKSVEQQAKEAEISLRELLATPTSKQAKEELTQTLTRIQALHSRLEHLSQNCSEVISAEDRDKIRKSHEKLNTEYRKRKRICVNAINAIMEGYPKTKKALMEEIGVETDESVKMSSIQSY